MADEAPRGAPDSHDEGRAQALPPSVRLIQGFRDLVHRRWRGTLGILAVLGIVVWVGAGVYTVANDEGAAQLRFGALAEDAVGPGLHLALPGVHEVFKARTQGVSRLEIVGDDGQPLPLLTSDSNLILAALVVQYRIGNLGDHLFATEDPAQLVRQTARAAAVEVFTGTDVDSVLTSGKAQVQNQVRDSAQERLDAFGAGVILVAVNLQSVDPPTEAATAFRDVSNARADAAQLANKAEGERERALRLARGEAEQLLSAARSRADARIQRARGAADRFTSLLRQHRASPQQARTELYHRTLAQVLPRAKLVVLRPGDGSVSVHLLDSGGDAPPMPTGPMSRDQR
ncbi:MAG: FtsH protease activity modulator HflK [Acidobacteriota bacterium]